MSKIVLVGSNVILDMNGKKLNYTLVYSEESNPDEEKISIESPLGQALLGQDENSIVDLALPGAKKVKCRILKVQ